ncbi:MAG: imidazolonepropionase [Acidobacteria bacterium]|nr:imidazolonepropionase [Acidobacteriota bacterium]
MPLLTHIGVLSTPRAGAPQGTLESIPDACLVWRDDRIAWVGPRHALPAHFDDEAPIDARGRLVVPGLVDCHTHLAFGGWRADEFDRRLRGESYLDIARTGGGILRTVAQTRAASFDSLLESSREKAHEMLSLGVTTLECKSGYGLDVPTELRLLEVYATLARVGPQRIVPTFLGAHTVPAEHRAAPGAFLDVVCHEMLPAIAERGLARFCDVFVEDGAFTPADARRLMAMAQRYGLRPKLHVDQLHDGGGAALAAELEAISADHLEHVSAHGIERLAEAGVVAVSLPIASLYLQQPPMPARPLLEAGVPVAVATDFNPGTAPSGHLPLAMTLACTTQRMTPGEVLAGATLVAARAIGLEGEIGSLEPGKRADFALIDAPDVGHWLYRFRGNACTDAYIGGACAWSAPAA